MERPRRLQELCTNALRQGPFLKSALSRRWPGNRRWGPRSVARATGAQHAN